MYEIQCFDFNGNTINHLTQWDIDQSLVIPIDSLNMPSDGIPILSEGAAPYDAPEVHFSNRSRNEALIVRSVSDDGKSIVVKVPNILLQEAYPLQVYVYMTDPNDSDDYKSQKTILHNEIPIRKRQKPSDYLYVQNITPITAEIIKDEITTEVSSVSTTAISDITKATEAAVTTVDNQMKKDYDEGTIVTDNGNTYQGGFINVGNEIITELDSIKSDSKLALDGAQNSADTAYDEIMQDVQATLTENGFSVISTYDGEGNVNISILMEQSS